jgi:AcrR family transcriptional regulator
VGQGRSSGLLALTRETGPGLPRGRSSLPATDVRAAQRDRMLRAMVAAAADRGYAEVTVADVVAAARVSRTSFYAQFADRDDCLFAATAEGRRLMFAAVADAVHAVPGDDDVMVLRAGLRAYLGFLAAEPAFAAVFYLELPAVGRRGADRLADARHRLATRTAVWHARARARHPSWPQVVPAVYRALTGATEELVRDQVRAGTTGQLAALEDVIVDLHLRLLTA